MLQKDLLLLLEQLVPTSLAASWDKSGIQVASSRDAVTHIAVGLDPTPRYVRNAMEIGADFLLTHHPLTLSPRYPDRLDSYHYILSQLFSHNVMLYAVHTCLDSLSNGSSVWLADALELNSRCVLEKSGMLADGTVAGIGCAGDLPFALDAESFLKILKLYLPIPFSVIGKIPETIRRVAICPGSGSSLLAEAKATCADIYITGDFRYHSALDVAETTDCPAYNEKPFAVLDVGHFYLEEEMTRRFSQTLAHELPDLRVTFIPGSDPFTPDGVKL